MHRKVIQIRKDSLAQLKVGLYVLSFTLIVGTIGYSIIEEWDLFDSFYMTVITITTTGFKEVHPLSPNGKVLTVFVLITGFASLAYTAGRAVQFFIESQIFRRRIMSKKLEALKDHYIVSGFGRMGKAICTELEEAGVPFIVIENNSDNLDKLSDKGYLFVEGDGASEEAMSAAKIDKAKGLVAVLSNDAENVFAALSAKELNPDIYIVARAVQDETESKLKKAGADRVVKPYELGGLRMAQLLLRPGVTEFVELVVREQSVDISIEEVNVTGNSSLAGKSLAELPLRKEFNIIIVAIFKKDGTFTYNPQSSAVIDGGDKLIAIGEKGTLQKFNKICFGEEKVK